MEDSDEPLFGRLHQQTMIKDLLGDLSNPPPFIHLTGLPGTGKTSVIKSFLRNLQSTSIYIDYSITNFDNEKNEIDLIYKSILQQLKTGISLENDKFSKINNKSNSRPHSRLCPKIPLKVGSVHSFFHLLHKIIFSSIEECNQYSILLVIDSVDELVQNHPEFISAILRHKEYLSYRDYDIIQNVERRDLCLAFISRRPVLTDLFPGSLTPLTIKFDVYSREQLKEIFLARFDSIAIPSLQAVCSDTCDYKFDPEVKALIIKNDSNFVFLSLQESKGEIKFSYQKLKSFWSIFINDFVNMTYQEFKSDFHELKFLCRHMWVAFLSPIAQGNLKGKPEALALKLKKDIGPHIRRAISRRGSHFTADLYDASFLNPSLHPSLVSTIVVELSFIGRVLIVAASIAASTHPSRDLSLLQQSMKFQLKIRKKPIKSKSETKVSQNPFTFSRWISITDSLYHIVCGSKLDLNPFVTEQIASLVHMKFITPWNSIDINKGTGCMLGAKRSYSNFSNFPYFDPFDQPILFQNPKTLNNRRQAHRLGCFSTFDPQTKLCCRVPLSIIQETAKSLPGIKLQELI